MSARAVDHVWFWTRDMDRAVAFYGGVVELDLLRRDGDDWAEFDAGPVRLGLHGAGERSELPGGGTVVLRVDDLDASRLSLQERGVVFEAHIGEVEGRARFSSFADPDGNALQIIEYLDAHER